MGIVRKTKSVNLLLEVFTASNHAISVVQLVNDMSNKMNKTTVYRILERLEKEGIIHSFYGKEGLKWYAKCSECSSEKHINHNPQLQCTDCGKIESVPIQIDIPNTPNIQINSAEIMLTGTCSQCVS